MKKILSIALVVIMLFSMVSCFSSDGAVKIIRGKIEGDVYTNSLLSFSFTKPDSWIYATDEEIAEAVNLSSELLNQSFSEALEKTESVFDMMVSDKKTGTNISIGYENLFKTFSSNITVEQYINALKEQTSSVSGINVVFSDERQTVKFGNTEFTKVTTKTTYSGINMTQAYYLHKVGSYMAFVIITITNGYTLTDLEAMFK